MLALTVVDCVKSMYSYLHTASSVIVRVDLQLFQMASFSLTPNELRSEIERLMKVDVTCTLVMLRVPIPTRVRLLNKFKKPGVPDLPLSPAGVPEGYEHSMDKDRWFAWLLNFYETYFSNDHGWLLVTENQWKLAVEADLD